MPVPVKVMTPAGPVEATVGARFGETIKGCARHAGMTKFKVYVNGAEIKPDNAPATVEAGAEVILFPYDQPAKV